MLQIDTSPYPPFMAKALAGAATLAAAGLEVSRYTQGPFDPSVTQPREAEP